VVLHRQEWHDKNSFAEKSGGQTLLSLHPERQQLNKEQIDLVREVVKQRAPHLEEVVEKLAKGRVIPDDEMDELSELITYVMSEETDNGYTERGKALDDLVGTLWQWSEGYFADAEDEASLE